MKGDESSSPLNFRAIRWKVLYTLACSKIFISSDSEVSKSPPKKPNAKPFIPSVENDAVAQAIQSKFNRANVTKPSPISLSVNAFVTGTAKDVVQTIIFEETKSILGNNGYHFSRTQSSTAPGKAKFLFDFNTERGKERIAVGVTMNSDRAYYLFKKMKSMLP